MAEVLASLQASLNGARAHGSQAAVRLAHSGLRALLGCHLHDERAALNGVHEDESRLEACVRGPRTQERDCAAALKLVVFGVNVEEASLADIVTTGVLGDAADIQDIEAITVVGLVVVAVEDVLVVIDGAAGALVVAGVVRVFEIADVDDVGSGKTLGHGTNFGVALVELVVEEDVLLPCSVVDDSLMDVLRARVGEDGNDVRDIADLVSDIVDGKRVFVVAVADIPSIVAL